MNKVCKGTLSTLAHRLETQVFRQAMRLERAFLHVSCKTVILCIEVAEEVFKVASLRVPLSFDSLKKVRLSVPRMNGGRDLSSLFRPARDLPYHGLLRRHYDLLSLSTAHPHPTNTLKKNLEGETLAHVKIEQDSILWVIGALEFLKMEEVCPAFPILSVTLGPTLKIALIKSPSQIVAVKIKSLNLLYPKLVQHLHLQTDQSFENPLVLLEREVFDPALYQTYVEAFFEDVCKELKKELSLEQSLDTILVSGVYSSFVKEQQGNKQIYIVSPQMLRKRNLSADSVMLLGMVRNCQGPSYVTSTYPTIERLYEKLKGDSLADLHNHQVLLKQRFGMSCNLNFMKIDSSNPKSLVAVYKETETGSVPFAMFRAEEYSNFTESRLKAQNRMRFDGFTLIPRNLKDKSGSFLTLLGLTAYASIQYSTLDSDQEGLKRQFSARDLFTFSAGFHRYAKGNRYSNKLKKSRLDEFLSRFCYFESEQLKQWQKSLFESNMWFRTFEFAQFFKSDVFRDCYRNLPVQLIHGDLKSSDLLYVKGKPVFFNLPDMRTDVRLLDYAGFTDWSFFSEQNFAEGSVLSAIASYFPDLSFVEKINFHRILIFRKVEKLSRVLQNLSQALSSEAFFRVEALQEELLRLLRDLDHQTLF